MKRFTSKTQKIGEVGENIAEMFLVKHGFTILERNFTCKAGEIDIICKKADKIHFVEVKSVISKNVTHETRYNPFYNVTREKIQKCVNTIEFWLSFHEKHVSRETCWQFDGIAIFIDFILKKAHVEYLENINI